MHLTPLPPLQTGGDTGGIGGPLPAPRRAAPQVPPHPDPARPAAHHQAAAVVGNGGGGGGGGGGGSGGSSYASATAAWEPDCTSPGVGGGGSTGGGRGSSQYQHLHPHPYPPAPHRSRASAHPDPVPLLVSFCFFGRQKISKHTDAFGSIFNFESSTRSDPGSEFRIAYCMQARSISGRDWASWPDPPGDHRWLFGCPLKARHPSFLPFPSRSCQA